MSLFQGNVTVSPPKPVVGRERRTRLSSFHDASGRIVKLARHFESILKIKIVFFQGKLVGSAYTREHLLPCPYSDYVAKRRDVLVGQADPRSVSFIVHARQMSTGCNRNRSPEALASVDLP